jgi:hypothetical protein
MSVLVTGVPTRNLAKRKLKMREVDPSGATYSVIKLDLLIKARISYQHACIQGLGYSL